MKYFSPQAMIVKNSNKIMIILKPINNIKGISDNILFDLTKEEEKNIYFTSLINIFIGKESNQKKEFIKEYLNDKIIKPSKKLIDIFTLVSIFDDNFLDINFDNVFNNLEKFEFQKSFILTKNIKKKLIIFMIIY